MENFYNTFIDFLDVSPGGDGSHLAIFLELVEDGPLGFEESDPFPHDILFVIVPLDLTFSRPVEKPLQHGLTVKIEEEETKRKVEKEVEATKNTGISAGSGAAASAHRPAAAEKCAAPPIFLDTYSNVKRCAGFLLGLWVDGVEVNMDGIAIAQLAQSFRRIVHIHLR